MPELRQSEYFPTFYVQLTCHKNLQWFSNDLSDSVMFSPFMYFHCLCFSEGTFHWMLC